MEYNYDNLSEQDCREIELIDWKNRIVRHFKGDFYIILDKAQHTETGEDMIVYRALYGDCKLYVRPIKMFAEKCTQEQFEKYGQEYRFQQVELPSNKNK